MPIFTCMAVPLTGSGNTRTAACTVSNLLVGTRKIVAKYGGDANNAAVSSTPYLQTIVR